MSNLPNRPIRVQPLAFIVLLLFCVRIWIEKSDRVQMQLGLKMSLNLSLISVGPT